GAVQTGTTDATGFDLVVNATPSGMRSTDPLPVDAARLEPSAYVADLITRPALTPLLEAARRRGSVVVTGEDMVAPPAGRLARDPAGTAGILTKRNFRCPKNSPNCAISSPWPTVSSPTRASSMPSGTSAFAIPPIQVAISWRGRVRPSWSSPATFWNSIS